MMILPKGAFMVLPDAKEEKTKAGIILVDSLQKEPDTGTIIYTAKELNNLQGKRVRFRANFAEELEIEGKHFKFFRDLDSSIFYIID